jgi:capsular polysaccharide biosynthesis protein
MALSHGDESNRALRVEYPPRARDPEIRDYLRSIRRRWWIVILVPAFAAGIVLWVHSDDPVKYSATATVTARSLIGHVNSPYVGNNSTEEFVADFQATATQKPVLEAVSQLTQVLPRHIKQGLTVTPVSTDAGLSALIDVDYVTTERDEAGPVAKQVAVETVRALFKHTLNNAGEEEPFGSGTTGTLSELLQRPQTITLYPTTTFSTTQAVIREVQIAVGAGLFLAILIVLLADVLGPRGRDTEDSRVVYDDEVSSHETPRTAPRAPASGAR